MSAISVFKTESEAFLLSDSGAFSPETGEIVLLQPKAVMLPDALLAFAYSGNGGLLEVMNCIKRHTGDGVQQAKFIEMLPAILRDRHSEVLLELDGGDCITRLFVAMIDMETAKPRLFCISSDCPPFLSGAAPFETTEIGGVAVPAIDVSKVLPEGYISQPKRDAAKIVAAQRNFGFETMKGHTGVAGECRLITINANGCTSDVVAHFPEKVGERCDPELQGVAL